MALPKTRITILLGIYCAVFQISYCTIESYTYKTDPCSDSDVEDILRSRVVQENKTKSLYHCGVACKKTQWAGGCKHAIYRKSNSLCKIVENAEVVSSLPEYTHEEGCTVIHYPAFCQNGGVRFGSACTCPKEFTGRYCQLSNPASCRMGEWRLATEEDYPMLATSQIPIKMVTGADILPVASFDAYYHNTTAEINYIAQVNGFLAWNEENSVPIDEPYQISFRLHNPLNGTSLVARLHTNGDVDISKTINDSVKLYIPTMLDNERLVYSDTFGNLRDVSLALSLGHQLLQRDFRRVEFDKDTHDAVFEVFDTRVALDHNSNIGLVNPLNYRSYKESMTAGKRYGFNQQVNDLETWSPYEEEVMKPYLEVDRCWTKMHDNEDTYEFASMFEEYVKRGEEIRVAVEGNAMSEIAEIRITDADIIAQLAPYVSPMTNDQPVDSNSKMTMPAISLSQKMALCQDDLDRSNPVRLPTRDLTEKPVWYATTRQWRKVYTVDKDKNVLLGAENDIIQAARQGKTVRVCFLTVLHDYYYYGRGSTRITQDGHLLFQTSQIMRLEYASNKLDSIYDSDCRKFVRVMSTEGWIKRIGITPGASSNEQSDHDFITIDWFVEE